MAENEFFEKIPPETQLKRKRKKNSEYYERIFLIWLTPAGFLISTGVVALGIIGVIALPFTLGNSVIFILMATSAFSALGKYLGRGAETFIKEDDFTNKRLASLVGFVLGIGIAITIIFFPGLAFVPLGVLGLLGISSWVSYSVFLIVLPTLISSAADKYGQILDYFTSKTIFDLFRKPKKLIESREKDPEKNKERKKKDKLYENRGLIIGVTIGTLITIILLTLFTAALPFSAPSLALLIISSCIYITVFTGLFCVPFKYPGRILDLFKEKKPTNQRIAALVAMLVATIFLVVRIFIPGFGLVKSAISALLNPQHVASTFLKLADWLGTIGASASMADKLGQFFDFIQKGETKKTILDVFKWLGSKFQGACKRLKNKFRSAKESVPERESEVKINNVYNGLLTHSLSSGNAPKQGPIPTSHSVKAKETQNLFFKFCCFFTCFRNPPEDIVQTTPTNGPQLN